MGLYFWLHQELVPGRGSVCLSSSLGVAEISSSSSSSSTQTVIFLAQEINVGFDKTAAGAGVYWKLKSSEQKNGSIGQRYLISKLEDCGM